MYYVNANDVIKIFKRYIREYDGKVTHTDMLIEELEDAIESADCIQVSKER